jgi:mono/diheme cytochrome c family protein
MIVKASRNESTRINEPASTQAEFFATPWLKLALVAIACYALESRRAEADDKPNGKALFHAHCVTGHGPDGAGSKLGKRINVPDLRSRDVQRQSNADLIQIVSDGRKNMHSFKNALTQVEINSLIGYVRKLAVAK